MERRDLLDYKFDLYSQNGEDGIIAAIFDMVGSTTKTCCEFGAWDGVHFSNCRKLILEGWSAVMIEADQHRFNELVYNYRDNPLVICVNRSVDAGPNNLGSILREHDIGYLDFLSIDIDGLDYEILETLEIRPRVISIEVNAGHSPDTEARLDRDIAKNNVGQPLGVFVQVAKQKGYDLACYTANAFFVLHDIATQFSVPILSSKLAYQSFLGHLAAPAREWLYLVNLGVVVPYFRYANPYLASKGLGIRRRKAIWLILKTIFLKGIRLGHFFAKAWRT